MGRTPDNGANRWASPAGLGLAFALAFAAAPRGAQAGCHAPIDSSTQSAMEAGVIPLRLSGPEVPPEPLPCPLGICSQGTPPSSSAPVPPPPAGPEHWPCFASSDREDVTAKATRLIAERVGPYRPPSSPAIERPPRPC